jgi:hypothetical protein
MAEHDYIKESMLVLELRNIVEDIVERRYNALVENLYASAKKWAGRASRELKNNIRDLTLKEIGIKGEVKAVLGYF